MLFKALQPGVPPLLRRDGKTPLHGYVKKGDVFEWIVGPPYPHWAEPADDEAKAAVAAVAVAAAAHPGATAEQSVADRMAALRAKRKPRKKRVDQPAPESAPAEG